MAIESITGKSRLPLATKTIPKTEVEGENKAAKQAEKSDSVAITGVAKEIKKAVESSVSEPVVDLKKVASVKKSLAEGSYQINSERIAEKMLQHEKMLS